MNSIAITSFDVSLVALCLFLLMAGHWAPWGNIPYFRHRHNGKLPRTLCYIYGVGSISSCFAFWLVNQGDMVQSLYVALVFVLLVVAAAAGTILPRIVEMILEGFALQEDARDAINLLEKTRQKDALKKKRTCP